MTLDLRSPFRYRKTNNNDPFSYLTNCESIACFELQDPASIEPDRAIFLGSLFFTGDILKTGLSFESSSDIQIGAGTYLFAQVRGEIDRDTFIGMAIELQKEGLWRQYQLDSRVYLRSLSEEDGRVFQVLRPFSVKDA